MTSMIPWLVFGAATEAAAPGSTWAWLAAHLNTWLIIGFAGQLIFTARFLIQWLASEKKRDSVVPVAFWWLSMAGGLTLLCYAVHREDPVIIVGQGLGVFIYVRNLMLVSKGKKRAAKARHREAAKGPHHRPATEPTRSQPAESGAEID